MALGLAKDWEAAKYRNREQRQIYVRPDPFHCPA
jgi:hypothetical protein